MLPDPPPHFDSTFFDWLELASDELSIIFADLGGLTAPEIQQLEATISIPIPSQIRVFYQHCSPLGMWRSPMEVWDNRATAFRETTGVSQQLLPLDIASLQGNSLIAVIDSAEEFRIAFHKNKCVDWSEGNLHSYFVHQVMSEIELTEDDELLL